MFVSGSSCSSFTADPTSPVTQVAQCASEKPSANRVCHPAEASQRQVVKMKEFSSLDVVLKFEMNINSDYIGACLPDGDHL